MPLYRVDKRNFTAGQVIECNPDSYYHAENFDNRKRQIEDILEESKPDKNIPLRRNCLFVFHEFYDAVRFWIKMTDSNIYEVKRCENTVVYFRGDMNFTDFMQHTDNHGLLLFLAEQYWSEAITFKLCRETLVNKVQIVKKITEGEPQRKEAWKEYTKNALQIEALTFYKEKLPR